MGRQKGREFQEMLQHLDTPSKPYVRMPSFFKFSAAETSRHRSGGERRGVPDGAIATVIIVGVTVALSGYPVQAAALVAVPLLIFWAIAARNHERDRDLEFGLETSNRRKRRRRHH